MRPSASSHSRHLGQCHSVAIVMRAENVESSTRPSTVVDVLRTTLKKRMRPSEPHVTSSCRLSSQPDAVIDECVVSTSPASCIARSALTIRACRHVCTAT